VRRVGAWLWERGAALGRAAIGAVIALLARALGAARSLASGLLARAARDPLAPSSLATLAAALLAPLLLAYATLSCCRRAADAAGRCGGRLCCGAFLCGGRDAAGGRYAKVGTAEHDAWQEDDGAYLDHRPTPGVLERAAAEAEEDAWAEADGVAPPRAEAAAPAADRPAVAVRADTDGRDAPYDSDGSMSDIISPAMVSIRADGTEL
jgi:hypothetical protein